MNLLKIEEKLNRENIINRQTIEYLYSKNRCEQTMADDFDFLHKIANEVFNPDQFEIQLYFNFVSFYKTSRYNFTNDNYSNRSSNFTQQYLENFKKPLNIELGLCLVIKYDHLTITNSLEDHIDVDNLYVCLYFDHEKSLSLIEMKGTRTDFSIADHLSGYVHSHLPSMESGNVKPKYFCLGSEEVKLLLHQLNMKPLFNANKLKLMLLQIQPYLEWESIEGKPYKYMKDVYAKGNQVTKLNASSDIIVNRIPRLFETLIQSNDIHYYFDLATNKYEMKVNDAFIQILSDTFPEYCYFKQEEKYFQKYSDNLSVEYLRTYYTYTLSFQGKQLIFNLTNNPTDRILPLELHSDIVRIIQSMFNNHINNYLLKYYGKRQNQTHVG